MYDPPSETNWVMVGSFHSDYREQYDNGYNDAKNKKEYQEPYPSASPYGHGGDELNYWYYSGYYAFEEVKTKES